MKALRTAVQELYGLFVEDGSYALAMVAWLFAAAFLLPRLVPLAWRAPMLFVGLLLILCENLLRSAHKS